MMDNQTLAKEIQIVSDEVQFLLSMLKNTENNMMELIELESKSSNTLFYDEICEWQKKITNFNQQLLYRKADFKEIIDQLKKKA